MKTASSKTVGSMGKTIREAWSALERATRGLGTGSYGEQVSNLLEKALKTSAKLEKEHRAFGSRFTDGLAGYRLPVQMTAQYFVLKFVLEADPAPKSWLDVTRTREDVVLAYAIAEALGERVAELPRAVLEIDYANDIAKP
jgi:hypothetical protein